MKINYPKNRKKHKTLYKRFWEKVDEDLMWTGAKNPDGYGVILDNGKTIRAHRVSYEFFYGQIPDGMQVLHHCDIPRCVNPNCLHLGDNKMNIREREQRHRGRVPNLKGENHGYAKLTRDQVIEIIDKLNSGISQASLGREYNVTRSNIGHIARGRSWKHLSSYIHPNSFVIRHT